MLISPEYQKEQEALHATGTYGTASIEYAPLVSQIVDRMGISHLLDYGCGSLTNLAKHLKLKPGRKFVYQAYDPGVERFSKTPFPAEMVCCIDVLEHIEPDYLDAVLDDLVRLTEGIVFASIHTGPAIKTLSDGRNAHLTQEPLLWWLPKLWERFDLQTVQVVNDNQFYVIAYAKPRIEATDGSRLS